MIVAENAVPGVNSAANSESRDVIGNKDDDHDGNSILADVHTVLEHIHTASKVYPTLVAGVAVAGAAGAWGLGSFVEIVPNAGIGSAFDIHYISVEALDDNAVYELVIYAVETEIGRVRFTKNANQDGIANVPFITAIIPGGTQIQAKLASSTGNSVATISIFYHTY